MVLVGLGGPSGAGKTRQVIPQHTTCDDTILCFQLSETTLTQKMPSSCGRKQSERGADLHSLNHLWMSICTRKALLRSCVSPVRRPFFYSTSAHVDLGSLAEKLTSVLKGTVIHLENYLTGGDADDYDGLDMVTLLDNLRVWINRSPSSCRLRIANQTPEVVFETKTNLFVAVQELKRFLSGFYISATGAREANLHASERFSVPHGVGYSDLKCGRTHADQTDLFSLQLRNKKLGHISTNMTCVSCFLPHFSTCLVFAGHYRRQGHPAAHLQPGAESTNRIYTV